MEYRQSAPEHKEWATALKAFMTRLQSMASSQFPQGLTWVGTATPSATAPPSPPAPPAAATPSTDTVSEDTSAATAATGVLLSECLLMTLVVSHRCL